MYKTIIKMSTENKITTKNTWGLDLIDHMGDMIKDDSNIDRATKGINFQKASCTLDASVKIYSSRVDDTWSSSFRVLENLSRNDGGFDSDEAAGGDAGGARIGTKAASKRLGLTETIEHNPSMLNIDDLDADSAVDPMFHKMSLAFDEGGAKGMLLTNLRVDPAASIITFSDTLLLSELQVGGEGGGGDALGDSKYAVGAVVDDTGSSSCSNGLSPVLESAVEMETDEPYEDKKEEEDNDREKGDAVLAADASWDRRVESSVGVSKTENWVDVSSLLRAMDFSAADLVDMPTCPTLNLYRTACGVACLRTGIVRPSVSTTRGAPDYTDGQTRVEAPTEGHDDQYDGGFGGTGDYGDENFEDENPIPIDEEVHEAGSYDGGDGAMDELTDSQEGEGILDDKKEILSSGNGAVVDAAASVAWSAVFNEIDSATTATTTVADVPMDDGTLLDAFVNDLDETLEAGSHLQPPKTQPAVVEEPESAAPVVDAELVAGDDYNFFARKGIAKVALNSWAGARHWKFGANQRRSSCQLKRAASKDGMGDTQTATSSSSSGNDGGGKDVSTKKFCFDFSDEWLAEDHEAFALSTGRTDPTTLTAAAVAKSLAAAEEGSLMLPPDAKLELKDMFRLFLQPTTLAPHAAMYSSMQRQLLETPKELGRALSHEYLWGQAPLPGHTDEPTALEATAVVGESVDLDHDGEGVFDFDENFAEVDGGGGGARVQFMADSSYSGVDVDYDVAAASDEVTDAEIALSRMSVSSVPSPVAIETETCSLPEACNEVPHAAPASALGLTIDMTSMAQSAKRVEKIEIGYAKVAKRVNVRRLKTDLWAAVDRGCLGRRRGDEEKPVDEIVQTVIKKDFGLDVESPSSDTDGATDSLSFQETIADIAGSQRGGKDVTLPFYFICLLHLANEKTLKIEGHPNMMDLTISKDF